MLNLHTPVRNILRVVDLQDFNRFLRACALRTGQVLSYSDLAQDTGIAPNTARNWMNLLQTSAVVTLIEPFFGNRTKRLIKAPKLAFLDIGDAGGLRALAAAEKDRTVEAHIVCRTPATYRLSDGTWVMSLPDLLKKLDASTPAP